MPHQQAKKQPDKGSKYPSILGCYYDDSASSYYRVILPLRTIRQHMGIMTSWGRVDRLEGQITDQYDIVVLSRPSIQDEQLLIEALEYLNAQKKLIIVDYDDNLLDVPDWNPSKPSAATVSSIKRALELAHGAIVPNATLASRYREFNTNIIEMPNYIETNAWPDTRVSHTKTIIGLAGSTSHIKDWEIISEAMHRIMDKYHDYVEFMVAGFVPPYLRDIVTISPGWVPLRSYPTLVNQIDIGLCPLIDDYFNRCKTPIKALEYGMAGAAIVASPTQYRDVIRGRGTIAQTSEEWYNAIEKYLLNPQERDRCGHSMRRYIHQRWDARRHVQQIADVYRTLYRNVFSRSGPALVPVTA